MRLHKGFQSRILAILGAVAVLGVYAALIAIGGTTDAAAQPSAPAYLGEVVESEMPGGNLDARSVAVQEATGDVYVGADTNQNNVRLLELSPYGAFVREIGSQVDHTKVRERRAQEAAKEPVTVTRLEEDTCTAASGDECGESVGAIPGVLENPARIAIEQSTGAIYLLNAGGAGDVVKFASNGSFAWAIGNEVDKTKVQERENQEANSEPVTVSKEEEDTCTGASGDECQEAQKGVTGGVFEAAIQGIAIGGPEEHVYVGDKGRVRIFDSTGHQVGEHSLSALSASGTPTSLAVSSTGDVFLADEGVEGVHELEPSGTLSSNVYGSFKSWQINSLAVDGSGHLYVGQYGPVLEYEVSAPAAAPAELGGSAPGKVNQGQGVVADRAGTVYVAHGSNPYGALIMFGSLPAMEAAYGLPSAIAPTIAATPARGGSNAGEVTVEALVNPQLRTTTYQFQYGLQLCSSGGCTDSPAAPATIGSVTKTLHSVAVTLTGLQSGRTYYFRVLAANVAGTTASSEQAFSVGAPALIGTPGLPDGRRYELVSPANKDGNAVEPEYMSLASAGGDHFLFNATGAMGTATSSTVQPFVSTRTPDGWSTSSVLPPQVTAEQSYRGGAEEIVPSSSFTSFLFRSTYNGLYSKLEPSGPEGSVNIFLSTSITSEPIWLGDPTISNPIPAPGFIRDGYMLDGASPDLSKVYFTTEGTLTPQDEPRAPYVEDGTGQEYTETKPWGFYEWSKGSLSSAGVLPDGKVSAFGAMPAALAGLKDFTRHGFPFESTEPEYRNNQVSEDGTKAFFVSPDPVASTVTDARNCELSNKCTTEAPQLYVRETQPDGSVRTVLVSRSELPGHEGEPAPEGALGFVNAVQVPTHGFGAEDRSYVYASADGSQAFFLSTASLTSAAPANEEPKEYDFNLATETLTYLPGVSGPIAAVAPSGSSFMFEDKSQTPWELKLWTSGPAGGTVRPIAQLPEIPQSVRRERRRKEEEIGGAELEFNVDNAHFSQDGSAVVFGTNAEIPSGFNDGGGYWQMYRYSVASGELACVSCPPPGQAPAGDAEASWSNAPVSTLFNPLHSPIDTRVISSDGSRVFFDSPNALVPAAANGLRNVYEWESGTVYLISSGTSAENSYVMDSSASGNDVFFATSAGLVPADTDETYDVYDARVPRPGDTPPPSAVPCEGAVCQGPPSTPQLLGAPASATLSGPGNLAPAPPVHHRRGRHHKKGHHKRRRHRKRGRHHGRSRQGKQARHKRGHAGKGSHGRHRGRSGRAHGKSERASHRRHNGRGK